jgi:hypothetical protein
MGDYNPNSITTSNMSNNVADVVVESRNTDGATGQDETEWVNAKWSEYFGMYKTIPELKIALDMRAIWTLGKEINSDIPTEVILGHIRGYGKDKFRNILKNLITTRRINGDAFAEIIRDPDSDILINLKPLDPGSIKIIVDKQGVIKRYEQMSKTPGKAVITFRPDEIFHLTNKRTADEIHGVSDIEALADIITANKESFVDMRKAMHRFIKPMFKFILDTDDQTVIDGLVSKFDAAVNKGENIYIPKGTVEQELISVPSNSTLSSSEWRSYLKDYFFQVVGIPQIILGSSGEFTESTAKIAYLAFEQSVEDEQTDLEDQVWEQLGLRIELSFPASLQNEMLSDTAKDGADNQLGLQPSDTTAGVGR